MTETRTTQTTTPTASGRRSRRLRTALVAAAVAVGLAGAACGEIDGAAPPAGPGLTMGENEAAAVSGIEQAVPTAKRSTKTPRSNLGNERQSAAQQAQTMDVFMTSVLQNVDAFWSQTFKSTGLPEPWVNANFPTTGESLWSECTPHESNDLSAYYCYLDDQLVISQKFAYDLWNGSLTKKGGQKADQTPGDFAVAYVVAHEYAHSLQQELDVLDKVPVTQSELHADCWAGVWANSAYYQGILDPDDISQAITAASFFGDTDFNDPGHHGTPEERVAAFSTGYNSGRPADCGGYLDGTASAGARMR